MLRMDSRNMSLNAVSLVGDVVVASFNASVSDPDSNAYISINIDDIAAFRANTAAVKADISSFVDEIAKDPNEEV